MQKQLKELKRRCIIIFTFKSYNDENSDPIMFGFAVKVYFKDLIENIQLYLNKSVLTSTMV